jgi:hypothetical protein
MASVHSRNALRLAVALAALCLAQTCGGNSPTAAPPPSTAPPPTTMPAAATLADLSAGVTSPEADASLTCAQDVHARVSLTNRAATGVIVTSVLKTSGVVAGDCFGAPPFTYRTLARVIFANSTTVLMDQALYNSGSGCCQGGRGCGGSCVFQESFQVVTELGNVPAGTFNYKVFFQNCQACSSAASARSLTCPPSSRATAAGAQ